MLILYKLGIFWLFLGVGVLTYANALNGPFMVDDRVLLGSKLLSKSILGEFMPPAIDNALPAQERRPRYYRPVHHATLIILYRVFGENVFPYHLLNLLLFVLAAFLVALTTAALSKNQHIGLLTGLFYLVHPINGVLVNYITASAFSFQVIFMILSLRFLLKAGYWKLAVLFYLLALGCHESALVFPFYALVILGWGLPVDIQQAFRRTKEIWIVTAVYLIFRLNVASLSADSYLQYSKFEMQAGEYLASLIKVWLWYLSRLFYPDGIVLIWASKVVRTNLAVWIGLGLTVGGLCAALVWRYRNSRPSLVGLAWFLTGFLPLPLMCLLYPLFGLIIEPHWFIFSSIGFFLFIAGLCAVPKIRTLTKIVCVVLVVVWALTCSLYNNVWADEQRYYRYWYSQAPGILMIPYNLGAIHETLDHNLTRAGAYYQVALDGGYGQESLYPKWGYKAMLRGDLDTAEYFFSALVTGHPQSWEALNNLGVLAYQKKDYARAIRLFDQALRHNPSMDVVRGNRDKAVQKAKAIL